MCPSLPQVCFSLAFCGAQPLALGSGVSVLAELGVQEGRTGSRAGLALLGALISLDGHLRVSSDRAGLFLFGSWLVGWGFSGIFGLFVSPKLPKPGLPVNPAFLTC